MEVKEFQQKLVEFAKRWDEKRNNVPIEESTFIHLVEEVGEMAREYVSKRQRKEKYSDKKVNNAIADIIMQVVKLAHLRNLDIEELVLKTMKDEEQRLLEK